MPPSVGARFRSLGATGDLRPADLINNTNRCRASSWATTAPSSSAGPAACATDVSWLPKRRPGYTPDVAHVSFAIEEAGRRALFQLNFSNASARRSHRSRAQCHQRQLYMGQHLEEVLLMRPTTRYSHGRGAGNRQPRFVRRRRQLSGDDRHLRVNRPPGPSGATITITAKWREHATGLHHHRQSVRSSTTTRVPRDGVRPASTHGTCPHRDRHRRARRRQTSDAGFASAGTCGYHDHLNGGFLASLRGTIVIDSFRLAPGLGAFASLPGLLARVCRPAARVQRVLPACPLAASPALYGGFRRAFRLGSSGQPHGSRSLRDGAGQPHLSPRDVPGTRACCSSATRSRNMTSDPTPSTTSARRSTSSVSFPGQSRETGNMNTVHVRIPRSRRSSARRQPVDGSVVIR